MTMHKVMTGVTDDVPQWSQPGIGWMTTFSSTGRRSSGTRNGAGRGSAG